jgi:hypothetical protein
MPETPPVGQYSKNSFWGLLKGDGPSLIAVSNWQGAVDATY